MLFVVTTTLRNSCSSIVLVFLYFEEILNNYALSIIYSVFLLLCRTIHEKEHDGPFVPKLHIMLSQ